MISMSKGDVVVDAGAMEGDFALEYIEDIGKLYIFECDPLKINFCYLFAYITPFRKSSVEKISLSMYRQIIYF